MQIIGWALLGSIMLVPSSKLLDKEPLLPCEEFQVTIHEYSWVTNYLESIDFFTPVHEVTTFILFLRSCLEEKEYSIPSIDDMFGHWYIELTCRNIAFSKSRMNILYKTIKAQQGLEDQDFPIDLDREKAKELFWSSPFKKEHIEPESRAMRGEIQILTGSLLCSVPDANACKTGLILIANGSINCQWRSKRNEKR